MCFEKEDGPGMLQFNVQQTHNLQIIHRVITEKTHNQLCIACALCILAALLFVEYWTGDLVFKQPR